MPTKIELWYNKYMTIDQKSKKCESCFSTLTSKYGSGRFCSAKCARSFSTKNKRQEINNKVSLALKGKPTNNPWLKEAGIKGALTNREKKLDQFVKINSDILDITYRELEEYRKIHPVCEICLLSEKFTSNKQAKAAPDQLSVDHCHKTLKFRGLLCRACNYRLGWYENKKDGILKYMSR